MPEVKIVGRGVDTLVLNVGYADRLFSSIKQELADDVQKELNLLQGAARLNEVPILTRWAFQGIHLFMQERGSGGQWRWILKSPLLTVTISNSRLSCIIALVRFSSEFLWSCQYFAEAIIEVGLFRYGIFCDYFWFQVSEVNLCADAVRWDVSRANWQECFISRAVGDDGRPRNDALLVDLFRFVVALIICSYSLHDKRGKKRLTSLMQDIPGSHKVFSAAQTSTSFAI